MTKSSFQLKVLAGLLLAFASNASAAIFTNVPGGATTGLPFAYFGNAANPSGDSPKVGEVFSLTSAETLSSFSFYALGNTTASLQLNVAQWNPGTISPLQPLLATTGSAVETYNSTGDFTTLSFNNIGLNLNASTNYIAYLSSSDPTVTGLQLSRIGKPANDTFGISNAYFSTVQNNWVLGPNNGFLNLQYTAVTTPIPEPSTYAAAIGLLSLGFIAIRRRNLASV